MAVDILMSTYNGEKYLENQLLSLLMQRYKDWTLLIRDDGSSDSTLAIIEKFTQLDSRIKLVEKQVNLGFGKSFMRLLSYSSAEYVAFCDQDDIWFEDKLLNMVKEAERLNDHNSPLLICSQAYTYSDATGTITKGIAPRYHASNLKELLFLNGGYQGCLFLFNKPLLEVAKNYSAPFHAHDNIICLIAHSFGRVHFLKPPLMLYRQHSKNVSGNIAVGLMGNIKSFFRRKTYVVSQVSYDQNMHFFKYFDGKLTPEQKAQFELYFSFPKLSRFNRVKLILKNGFKLGQYRWVLVVKTIIRQAIM